MSEANKDNLADYDERQVRALRDECANYVEYLQNCLGKVIADELRKGSFTEKLAINPKIHEELMLSLKNNASLSPAQVHDIVTKIITVDPPGEYIARHTELYKILQTYNEFSNLLGILAKPEISASQKLLHFEEYFKMNSVERIMKNSKKMPVDVITFVAANSRLFTPTSKPHNERDVAPQQSKIMRRNGR